MRKKILKRYGVIMSRKKTQFINKIFQPTRNSITVIAP